MKKSKFSEAQIFEILKEAEAGAKTPELCRKHGISSNTFYTWRAKFGGMPVVSKEFSNSQVLKSYMIANQPSKEPFSTPSGLGTALLLCANCAMTSKGLRTVRASDSLFQMEFECTKETRPSEKLAT